MIKLKPILQEVLDNNKLIDEAVFGNVEIRRAVGNQRGTTESEAKTFDIILHYEDVVNAMKNTPMGEKGSMTSFSYEGPGGPGETTYNYEANTSQWDVWQNMNYVTVTPENHAHWYHGKSPGGVFKGKGTNKPLPELNIEQFGFKVYKGLILDPEVRYIVSDKDSTPQIKGAIYKWLMKDRDLIWITSGGDGNIDNIKEGTTYDDIIIMAPNLVNIKDITKKFLDKHIGIGNFRYSNNFPLEVKKEFENHGTQRTIDLDTFNTNHPYDTTGIKDR